MKFVVMAIMAAAAIALVACGGDAEGESTVHDEPVHSGSDHTSGGSGDGIQIEGLMGSMSDAAVHRGLDPRMPRFLSCFERRYGEFDYIGGRISLAFRISTDGSVRWVFPRASDIGDRQTERCILDVAQSTRFSEPQGGEAEFRFPFEVEPPEDVRPPFNWDVERIEDVLTEHRSDIRGCGGGPYLVTAYVAPGGAVVTAGASTTDEESADKLDCVTDAVMAWAMPDPGSYPAKVTFEVN